jgi:hypothetical protein
LNSVVCNGYTDSGKAFQWTNWTRITKWTTKLTNENNKWRLQIVIFYVVLYMDTNVSEEYAGSLVSWSWLRILFLVFLSFFRAPYTLYLFLIDNMVCIIPAYILVLWGILVSICWYLFIDFH